MALIKCTNCGKDVSDKAAHCPHCGADIIQQREITQQEPTLESRKSNKKRNIIITAIVVLLLAGGVTTYFLTRPPMPDETIVNPINGLLKDKKFASDLREAGLLSDTDSAVVFNNLEPESFVKYAEIYNQLIRRNGLYLVYGIKNIFGENLTNNHKQRLEDANWYVSADGIVYGDPALKDIFSYYPNEKFIASPIYNQYEYEEAKNYGWLHYRLGSGMFIQPDRKNPGQFKECQRNEDGSLMLGEEYPEKDFAMEVKEADEVPADDVEAVEEVEYDDEPQDIPGEEDIFYEQSQVDKQPQFQGGEAALYKYIAANVRYPKRAELNKIQGKIIVRFVVDNFGRVLNAEVIRGEDADLKAEALRVVSTLPNFIPAQKDGRDVACYFMLPISFKLPQK